MIPTEVEVTEDYIKASVWVKRGIFLVRRDALDINDLDSYWMLWWKKNAEILPEDLQIKIFGEPIDDEAQDYVLKVLQGKIHKHPDEFYDY